MTDDKVPTAYNSLDEIRMRREAISKEIDASEKTIKTLWHTLFASEEKPLYETPSKRMRRLLNTGAGMFDAALLGWKLYRKFSGSSAASWFGHRRK